LPITSVEQVVFYPRLSHLSFRKHRFSKQIMDWFGCSCFDGCICNTNIPRESKKHDTLYLTHNFAKADRFLSFTCTHSSDYLTNWSL